MELLKKNLAALADRQPELAERIAHAQPPAGAVVEPSRMGPPSLRVAGVLACSSVDPVTEGRRLAASAPSGPLAVFGFGLAYHLEPLAGRDLVVWEPDIGLLRLALAARDLTALLGGNLRLATTRQELGEVTGRGVLLFPSAARLHPEEARAVERLAVAAPNAARRPAEPRVLVVPPVYGGSTDIARWCREALEALGCRVVRPPLEAVEPLHARLRASTLGPAGTRRAADSLLAFLGEVVLAEARAFKPHLVLALAQAPLEARVLAELSKGGAKTAFWFVEDFRVRPYYREVAAAYDHFFHIQGQALTAQLRGLGAEGRHLPLAAHPPVHRPLELSAEEHERWGAEVGFMGEGYPNRVRALAQLARQVRGLRIWGTGWPKDPPLGRLVAEGGRRLNAEDVARVYNCCQVVLNMRSSHNPGAGRENLDYVNPRAFEVAACGGFQLADRSAALARVLAPEAEVAVYDDEDALPELIGHYLAHRQQRQAMAIAARRKVLTEHTYYHRMEEVLTVCLGPPPETAGPKNRLEEALDKMLERLAS